MTASIAFLRAINVAGRNVLAMAALRDCLGAMGLGPVRSHLQSGNLVFHDPDDTSRQDVERRLETEIAARFAVQVEVFVRGADELQRIIARNPFPDEASRAPSHLVVTFLRSPPAPARVAALQAAITGRERVEPGDCELYACYPGGIGRSRLTHALVERTLGASGTGRNWNTVVKLASLAGP